jgi:hypothetical protein
VTFPELTFEFAPTSNPYDPAPVWVDVTAKLRQFSTVVGRQQALDVFQPGQGKFMLDNRLRTFDPDYAAGPHYGGLLPNRQTALIALYAGTYYGVFGGFVDDWPQEYNRGRNNDMTLPVTDAFKLFARQKLSSPFVYETVNVDNATYFWPLDETAGTVASVRRSTGTVGCGSYSVDVGAPSLSVPGITVGSLQATAMGDSSAWKATLPVPFSWYRGSLPGGHWPGGDSYPGTIGVEFVYQRNAAASGLFWIFASDDFSTQCFDTGGALSFQFDGWTCSATHTITDTLPHHISVTVDNGANTWVIKIDGVACTGTPGGAGTGSLSTTTFVHGTAGTSNTNCCTLQNLIFWPGTLGGAGTAPSAARLTARAAIALTAWSGDTTGQRADRIYTMVGWPAGSRNIDTCRTVLGPASWTAGSTTAAEYLQKLEATERGQSFIQSGTAIFRSRDSLLTAVTSTVSQATYSDNPAATLHYSGLDFARSEQLIVNDVTVRWAGGSVNAQDATSNTTYTTHSVSVDSACRTADDALNLAQWILGHYKDQFRRIRSITFNPSGMNGSVQDAMYAECLGRQIGDRVTVVVTPQGIGAAITTDMLIEGIGHKVDPGVKWETTFWLSPAETRTYWRLGSSAIASTTDPAAPTTTRLAY